VATLAAPRHILENADAVPDYVIEKTNRVAKRHLESVKMYYDAGGKMAMGTDTGTPFNTHGNNAMELAYLVDAGVAAIDALQAATGNSADLVRDAERGRIREGMYADILIVNGDPTKDINMVADKANHRAVLKYGELAAGSLGQA
jgi:imidazolonepropionase-like amidohydrolase